MALNSSQHSAVSNQLGHGPRSPVASYYGLQFAVPHRADQAHNKKPLKAKTP